jgi:CxxC motif-containing protein (DUF1111 family)
MATSSPQNVYASLEYNRHHDASTSNAQHMPQMSKRWFFGLCCALAWAHVSHGAGDVQEAFATPLATLSNDERARADVGRALFHRKWVEPVAKTTSRDGLGPHYIACSCSGCHVQDGRGAPPDFRFGPNEQPLALLLRLSVSAVGAHGDPKPEPVYGDQFTNAAVPGVRPEGQVRIRFENIVGRFADGTRYTLKKPIYGVFDLAYGPLAPSTMISPRIAPQLVGLGLIDAIDQQDILDNAAAQAALAGRPIRPAWQGRRRAHF